MTDEPRAPHPRDVPGGSRRGGGRRRGDDADTSPGGYPGADRGDRGSDRDDRSGADPRGSAEQYTTALPRPGGTPWPRPPAPGDYPPPGPDYQETTVLRRPGASPPPTTNLPGARRRPALPPYSPAYPPPDYPPPGHAGSDYAGSGYAGADYPGAGYPGADHPGADDPGVGYPSPDRPRRGRSRARGAGVPPAAPGAPAAGVAGPDGDPHRGLDRTPRKLTVTRVAALRSKQLTHRGLEKFHGAVIKDGADRSGLGHLTYAVMGNYAVDAALAVALANTLFFAAAKAESASKVLLYLLLTVAPFAIIAPLIGPLLDRMQRGRRIALAASSLGRAALAVVMALNFDSWVIYPCALGMLVFSKSFGVLKAALTPRVLPETITLVKTNSRLSVFGLIAGGVAGAIAAGISGLTDSSGALWFTAACGLVGAWLCLRIPAWVESTAGEVPVQRSVALPRPGPQRAPRAGETAAEAAGPRRGIMPRIAASALWTNATIRIETGFLALFIAFVIKSRYQSASVVADGAAAAPVPDDEGWMQLLLLAAVGAAAGIGGFLGNALGARLTLRSPEMVALICLGTVIAAVVVAFAIPGLITATGVALVGSTCSSLAKVCLDSSIQHNLAEESRASAFGRSEAVLQLGWVSGGVIGLLLGGVWTIEGDAVYRVGFGIVALLLSLSSVQAVALFRDRSVFPDEGIIGALRSRRSARRAASATAANTASNTASSARAAGGRSAPTAPRARSRRAPKQAAPGARPDRRNTRQAGEPR